MLWRLDTLLKESVDWKNQHIDVVSLHERRALMEDKRNNEAQRPHTGQNFKRHISLVSLLLWRKMVAVHCFV